MQASRHCIIIHVLFGKYIYIKSYPDSVIKNKCNYENA